MLKKVVFVLTVVLIILSLFFLLKLNNKTIPEEKPLTICWWGSSIREEKTASVINLYKQKVEDSEILTKSFNWNEYWLFIDQVFNKEEAGDVIQEDYAYLNRDVKNKNLINLAPYIHDGTIDTSNIPSIFLDGGRIDNEQYGISLGMNAPAIIYAPQILDDCGIEKPDSNWSWEDFIDISIKIYETSGVKTLPIFINFPRIGFENILHQYGYSFYSPDQQSLGFSDISILVYFFELQLQLKQSGALCEIEASADNPFLEFFSGRSWVSYIWSNNFPDFCRYLNRPIEFALYPRIRNPRQPGTYIKPSAFFSITAASESPEKSARFINFFVNDIEANRILLGERGVPINTDVMNALRNEVSLPLKKVYDYISLVMDGNMCETPPMDPPGNERIMELFRSITIEVLRENITPEKGSTVFINEANSILSHFTKH